VYIESYVCWHILDAELLNELARREKQAGIFPEADVDLFMKVSSDVYGPLACLDKSLIGSNVLPSLGTMLIDVNLVL
jgi:hypothetical protein